MINFFDFDGDGYLCAKDRDLFTDDFVSHFNGTAERRRVFVETFHQIYEGVLLMDSDGDGRVDINEVADYLNHMMVTGTGDGIIGSLVNIYTHIMDTDGDGKVSRSEFVAFMSLNPRKCVKNPSHAFDRLDINHDGFLTQDELAIIFKQFYFGNDPNEPGAVLYGEAIID